MVEFFYFGISYNIPYSLLPFPWSPLSASGSRTSFALTGFDAFEIFFYKIGGMQGMERAYDFHELMNCTNTVNHLAVVEYGNNGLKFGRVHNKQPNIWGSCIPYKKVKLLQT